MKSKTSFQVFFLKIASKILGFRSASVSFSRGMKNYIIWCSVSPILFYNLFVACLFSFFSIPIITNHDPDRLCWSQWSWCTMIEMIYHLLPGELQLGLDGKDGDICSECDLHHHNYFMKILYIRQRGLHCNISKVHFKWSHNMNLFKGKNNHTSIPT